MGDGCTNATKLENLKKFKKIFLVTYYDQLRSNQIKKITGGGKKCFYCQGEVFLEREASWEVHCFAPSSGL